VKAGSEDEVAVSADVAHQGVRPRGMAGSGRHGDHGKGRGSNQRRCAKWLRL